jgi:chemotaxis protein MotA
VEVAFSVEKTTVLGIISGVLFIVISILLDGDLLPYINIPSVFIVVGGVLASTVVAYPMKMLTGLIKVIRKAFVQHEVDLNVDVEMVIRIANIARREGILALENVVSEENDPFLQKGIMLIVDGTDPELVRSIMETDLALIKERHAQGQAVLYTMSAFSPAYGMIGTLIGLINMLRNLSDTDKLGPSMAVALITTLYGVVLANLVFTPLAKKLKFQGDEECLRKELLLEGMLSIQDGENPRIIREKLNAFLSVSQLRIIQAQQAAQQEAVQTP